jgi:hypothetical protein
MANIESGTIFKFNIPFNLGVAYCKVVDFSSLSMYYGVTVKVYDFFDSEVSDVRIFRDVPLFMNPIPIARMPSVAGKYRWKRIGVLEESKDRDIPFYKEYIHEGFAWETLNEYISKEWYVLVDLKDKLGPVNFDKVRHLEELYLRSTVTIERRIAMQLLRYRGIDVEDFFIKNSADSNWRTDFNTQKFIPLYKTLPEAIRGRPLLKGWVPDAYLDYKWE